VFVVDDELRVLEPVVNAYEVLIDMVLLVTEMSSHEDVKYVSGSFVIFRIGGLANLSCGAIHFPVDSLYANEDETKQSEEHHCEQSLKNESPSERHFAVDVDGSYTSLYYDSGENVLCTVTTPQTVHNLQSALKQRQRWLQNGEV
jgi:hypothetical protein